MIATITSKGQITVPLPVRDDKEQARQAESFLAKK